MISQTIYFFYRMEDRTWWLLHKIYWSSNSVLNSFGQTMRYFSKTQIYWFFFLHRRIYVFRESSTIPLFHSNSIYVRSLFFCIEEEIMTLPKSKTFSKRFHSFKWEWKIDISSRRLTFFHTAVCDLWAKNNIHFNSFSLLITREFYLK